MLNYTLPGMIEHNDLLSFFIEINAAHSDMFFDDVCLASVYGGFRGSKLCGGRTNGGAAYKVEQVTALIERYNEVDVACNATFSNMFATAQTLEESAFDLAICETLEAGARSGVPNGAILYSDELAEELRERFSHITLIASTTKGLSSAEQVEEACERYDRVVLDYNRTHDEAFIGALSSPEKIEVMVNEYCTPGCPFREEHYRQVSLAQLEGNACSFQCRHEPGPQAYGFLQGLIEGDVFLKNADARDLHENYGIEHFKIVGRGLERYDIVDSLLYYLVQPDCWYEIRDFLVHHDYL